MKSSQDIIIEPILTEKSVHLRDKFNQYIFKVAKDATKPQIKKAIEELFKVKVLEVKVVNVKPKRRRIRTRRYGYTSSWKKAYVKLKEGDRIRIFEGA
ncbi:MAG: 50S ribosomal protein L23 [candidate division WOR-3 bacterium]|uniref:Large ribosomal subunit protein uL23 n=1 Tax=candidate division WOR-3 bacterium TaxID=2052148 RepID=A0A7V3ZSQ7_UNCW3